MRYFFYTICFVLFIFLTSCNSEENNVTFQNEEILNNNYFNRNKGIIPEETGFYHNEAINLYLAEQINLNNKVADQKISDVIKKMADLMAAKYPSAFNTANIDDLLHYFDKFTYVEDYGYDELKNNLISTFSNPSNNSETFLNFLQDVNADETITYKEIQEKIRLESDHSQEFLVFESILNSSYSLWSSHPDYQGNFHRCGRGGIIVDAGIGALLWFTGPIGILGGAAGSLIYMDNCENGNP